MHFNLRELDHAVWHVVVEFRIGEQIRFRQSTLLTFADRNRAMTTAAELNWEEVTRLRSAGCYNHRGRLVDLDVPNDVYRVIHESEVGGPAWEREE